MENIYELLNNAEMNLEEYEEQKLSDYEAKVVKKQILKTIRKTKKKSRKIKSSIAAACACAVIGVGSISVAANYRPIAELFQSVFHMESETQSDLVNKMGTPVNISVENASYKITAEAVIRDDINDCVIYRIEKSDGSTLNEKGGVCTDIDFARRDYVSSHSAKNGEWGSMILIEETANYVEFCDRVTSKGNTEDEIEIVFENLKLYFGEEVVQVDGRWELNFPFECDSYSKIVASNEPFIYGDTKGKIDTIMLSPIGFEVRVTVTSDEISDVTNNMPVKLCLKNGEMIDLQDSGSAVSSNEDGTWSYTLSGTFDKLILSEDMRKVVVGETDISWKLTGSARTN
jgi:hypothetical protein